LLVASAWLSREEHFARRNWILACAMPPVLLIGCALAGWLLHRIAMLVSGQPDPSYAYPAVLRLALGFGVLAVALACARLVDLRRGSFAIWFWMVALAILTAALLPGSSPYFLFPLLIAAPLLFVPFWTRWTGWLPLAASLIAAIAAATVWLGLCAMGESIMGLALHPLFTVPAAFGVMALLPLVDAAALSRHIWVLAVTGAGAVAVIIAIAAGLLPAYSEKSPQRLNIALIDDHIANKASWAIFTNAPLPEAFRQAAMFSPAPRKISPVPPREGYVAPIGITRYAPPSVIATIVPNSGGRRVALTLQGSSVADRMFLAVPNTAALRTVEIEGRRFDVSGDKDGTVVGCVSVDCRDKSLTLEFASARPANIVIGEERFRLPPDSAALTAARPNWTTPSQSGDTTLVFKQLRLH
jgi:hypothetical protein